ncbi:MAG: DUF169 domain-containing protein [Deltaproteobacteria bacterium]|nr:DUF169 domain-containing protein [Deltaproteobacteria bacterium]
MSDLVKLGKELEEALRLRTKIIAYKKLDRAADLEKIPGVRRIDRLMTFCQIPDMVRVHEWTVGVTNKDPMNPRCMNMCGLSEATKDGIWIEAAVMATTWMPSHEESLKQQDEYPRMPAGEAIVLAPLSEGKFDPDVVMIYGNVAQIMMLMCGLQKRKYENFHFSFLGEGDCSNSVARCYITGKPALGLGCYGERAMGQMADGEILLALPPAELERAVLGLRDLAALGFKYPIRFIGAEHEPFTELAEFYPQDRVAEAIRKVTKG